MDKCDDIGDLYGSREFVNGLSRKSMKGFALLVHGLGHKGVAVLLPGFASKTS